MNLLISNRKNRTAGHSNPKQYWLDPKHTKNKIGKQCSHHLFCNQEYEWCDDSNKLKYLNCPIAQNAPTAVLPDPQEPPRRVTYAGMTEENIDDWIAQSMNRNIKSMLNPQKKYMMPVELEAELKVRYRAFKIKSFRAGNLEDELYFPPSTKRKERSHLMSKSRKKQINLSELVVPSDRLLPPEDSKGNFKINQQSTPQILSVGTPIRLREQRKFAKKGQPKRRYGIFLENDFYYKRFIKQWMANQKKFLPVEDKDGSLRQGSQRIDDHEGYSNNKSKSLSKVQQIMQRNALHRKDNYFQEDDEVEPKSMSLVSTPLQPLGKKFDKLQESFKSKVNQKAAQTMKTILQYSQKDERLNRRSQHKRTNS